MSDTKLTDSLFTDFVIVASSPLSLFSLVRWLKHSGKE